MNLFDYLKWRAEHNQNIKTETDKDNHTKAYEALKLEMGELAGEIEGLQRKATIYEQASHRLVLSNHEERGDLAVELGKKIGRLEALKDRMDKMELKQAPAKRPTKK
jgi:hypothetical protein